MAGTPSCEDRGTTRHFRNGSLLLVVVAADVALRHKSPPADQGLAPPIHLQSGCRAVGGSVGQLGNGRDERPRAAIQPGDGIGLAPIWLTPEMPRLGPAVRP